jgi:uncharacterized protein (TIGR02588 family)
MKSIPNNRVKPRRTSRSFAEKVTFAFSLLVVGLLVGLVSIGWIFKSDLPPVLEVSRNEEIRVLSGEFYIPFVVSNKGGENVENVQIIGELNRAGKTEESGEQSLDFLSVGEQQEGAFIFHHNPEDGEVILRVASYKVP